MTESRRSSASRFIALWNPSLSPSGGNIMGGDPTRLPSLSTRWLGRPLPAFLISQNGEMPDNPMAPDGRPQQ